MKPHPVTFDVTRPEHYDRAQLALRLVILAILSLLGGSIGWTFMLVYLLLPAVAAVLVSQDGPARYLVEDSPTIRRGLHWLLALYAYLMLITDKLPTKALEDEVKFEVRTDGTPTMASALVRLVYSLPALLMMVLAGFLSSIVWLVSAVLALVLMRIPPSLHMLQLAVLRYVARMLAYHASLVEEYPTFYVEEHPHQHAIDGGGDGRVHAA